jgi:hypothetical protein
VVKSSVLAKDYILCTNIIFHLNNLLLKFFFTLMGLELRTG